MPSTVRADTDTDPETVTEPKICVRNLRMPDLDVAVALHESVMSNEFLTACGSSFLRSYYRAWMGSVSGIALVATAPADGPILGLLLGSLSPASHYRSMVRRDGAAMTIRLIARAVRRPGWGVELLRIRGIRYLRGLLKMVLNQRCAHSPSEHSRPGVAGRKADHPCPSPGRSTPGTGESRLGEITHLMVAPAAQGRGVGGALVQEVCHLGQMAKLDSLVVVTPPGWGAEHFYSRLGWIRRGEMINRSNERFVRYELTLAAGEAIDHRIEG
jgi:ribosomal protein S18 acetylase RimI-like enzyme